MAYLIALLQIKDMLIKPLGKLRANANAMIPFVLDWPTHGRSALVQHIPKGFPAPSMRLLARRGARCGVKCLISILPLHAACCLPAHAESQPAPAAPSLTAPALDNIHKQYEFSVGTGVQIDRLNWNEASASVNIASEVKWENLQSAMLYAGARMQISDAWELHGKINYGRIGSGSNQDSDYNGNNRTLEYSRSNNRGGGEVQSFSIGAGRVFSIAGPVYTDWIVLTPALGYALHQQYLTMTDGVQTIPASGPYYGLDNRYRAQWSGPWLGIDNYFRLTGKFSLGANISYSWVNYAAEANWNLRTEFAHPLSFRHTASGEGFSIRLAAIYQFEKNWLITLAAEQINMRARNGTDTTYFADGTVGQYPLNEANWESASLGCQLSVNY